MPKSYNQVMAELKRGPEDRYPDQLNFSDEAYTIALFQKQENRKAKGKVPFNYVFLNLDVEEGATKSTFEQFLNDLDLHFNNIPEGTRFHVVYKYDVLVEIPHFSNIDIQKRKNELSIILFDSANFLLGLPYITAVINKTLKSPYVWRNISVEIQNDQLKCSTFAYEQASRLSKISNLHETLLAQNVDNKFLIFESLWTLRIRGNEMEDYLEERGIDKKQFDEVAKKIVTISLNTPERINALPLEFGPLFRHMQSRKIKDLKKEFMGNDTLFLEEYIDGKYVNGQNHGAEIKRKRIKAKALDFLAKNKDTYKKIIKQKQGFDFSMWSQSNVSEEKSEGVAKTTPQHEGIIDSLTKLEM